MDINLINSFTPVSPLDTTGKQIGGSASGEGFGTMMKDAVESIDGANKAAEQEITKSVTGESTDLHKTIIALQSADLKLQLGLQVRNKLIGAYDEIMRMQV